MRAVVTRVCRAQVRTDGRVIGSIGRGLLVLAGVEKGDTEADVEQIASKVKGLRLFADAEGKMNLSVVEAGGGVLAVSQFTLLGDCRKGRRPSFAGAEAPERASVLFDSLVERLRAHGLTVASGVFRAHMEVESVNDGPVTLLLDSRKNF
ncbi:MAG: D-aminoacyl-tRNA deacylase [Thermodesulfobacteriota bacterium]